MDQQNIPRRNARLDEPGRRYRAGQVYPRAGADIRPKSVPVTSKPSLQDRPKRTAQTTKPALPRTKRSMVLRRQMVERAEAQRVKVKKVRVKHYVIYTFIALLVVAAGAVGWSFRDVFPITSELFKNKPVAVNSVDSDKEELSTLDETEVSIADIAANQVAPDSPKTIKIPKLNIQARIRQVGTTLSNEPIAPTNIFDVGWYEGSSSPAMDGAVLLNGHTTGPSKAGVFGSIRQLTTGDLLILELGNGQVINYKVSKIQEYTSGQIDMGAATNPIDPTRKGLNLVTTLTKFSGTQKRVIVFALQQ